MNDLQRVRRRYEYLIFGSIGAACLGVLQFAIAVLVAIQYFPGTFSLSTNLLTDLGQDENDYSWIFNTSIILLGLSLAPLFLLLPLVETRAKVSKYLVAVSGCGSSLGLILLGLTPNDNYFIEHYAAMFLWAIPTVVTVMAFFYLVSNNPNMSLWFTLTCLITVVAMLAFLLGTQDGNHKILQRILLVYGFLWFGFLVFFAFRCGQIALQQASEDHISVDELADSYRSQLAARDHRRP